MADFDCPVGGSHDYAESSAGSYYKRRGPSTHEIMDQNVAYSTLYCKRCGATKEIRVQDHGHVQDRVITG